MPDTGTSINLNCIVSYFMTMKIFKTQSRVVSFMQITISIVCEYILTKESLCTAKRVRQDWIVDFDDKQKTSWWHPRHFSKFIFYNTAIHTVSTFWIEIIYATMYSSVHFMKIGERHFGIWGGTHLGHVANSLLYIKRQGKMPSHTTKVVIFTSCSTT